MWHRQYGCPLQHKWQPLSYGMVQRPGNNGAHQASSHNWGWCWHHCNSDRIAFATIQRAFQLAPIWFLTLPMMNQKPSNDWNLKEHSSPRENSEPNPSVKCQCTHTNFATIPIWVPRGNNWNSEIKGEQIMKSSILLLLNYHKWLGYLPFVQLKILAHARLIPRACLYGKSHWKPWHATGTKQAKLRQATAPGQVVAVDQLMYWRCCCKCDHPFQNGLNALALGSTFVTPLGMPPLCP